MLPINKESEHCFKTCNKCINGLVQVVQDKPSTNLPVDINDQKKRKKNQTRKKKLHQSLELEVEVAK